MNKFLKFTTGEAEAVLLELYGIKGNAFQLPGEIDFNYRIEIGNKRCYILKISRANENENYLQYQQKILEHIVINGESIVAPKFVYDLKGNSITSVVEKEGELRHVRLLSWVPGRVWSLVNPHSDDLRYSLGEKCGLLTSALQGFDHECAHRAFIWDIAQSLWTKKKLHLFSSEEKNIIIHFLNQFENFQDTYSKLRKSTIHNDANDNNILVSHDLINPKVLGIIDFGDAIHTQIINDVAIACAYAMMHFKDPLEAALPIVKGYHESFPLQEKELIHLYTLIAMRLVISVTKSAINKVEEPDNTYLLVSKKPAWELINKWYSISPEFAHFSFRTACGFQSHPNHNKFEKWALNNNYHLSELFPSINKNNIYQLDLSVSSKWIGHEKDFNDLDFFQLKIDTLQKKVPNKIIAGGYLEPRPIYTSTEYDKVGNSGRESRSMHLGIDFWLPAFTPVHALFDGKVVMAVNDEGDKEYGGLIVLKHQVDGVIFFTLYGHLTAQSATKHKLGDFIQKGEKIAELGDYKENGNWAPHLHFQIMLSLLDFKTDFPGVAYNKQVDVWKSICPNPNLLFKLKDLQINVENSNEDLMSFRKRHLGKSLSLQYKEPIKMVRGSGVYLMDQFGRKYLDTLNNVAHVGHENYEVVKAGQEQMALLNTNSRYLHENINKLAEELLETLPPELTVLHFVNSGSEANELAIRMLKAATGERDILVSEVGYHGNTNMCVDISSYKFDGKGGSGAPEYTHVFPLPDTFRGKYRGVNSGLKYAEEVDKLIRNIKNKGRGVAGFIIEPIISCGGQIELPKGFLSQVYHSVKEEGGLCISDEVQTGCGRMGKTFWGFQLHDVVPDIVTIGKPLGNGHPIAAVACTQEVANKFANGMEYFNTFGGNPVSCAIAMEVIKIIKQDNLQENAWHVGKFLKSALRLLSKEFPIIGDVRGQGLFIGIELVDANKNPLADHTDYLVNRMKEHGILMSSDGPDHNVLKIKPPIVFTIENAKELIFYLRKIFLEDFMMDF